MVGKGDNSGTVGQPGANSERKAADISTEVEKEIRENRRTVDPEVNSEGKRTGGKSPRKIPRKTVPRDDSENAATTVLEKPPAAAPAKKITDDSEVSAAKKPTDVVSEKKTTDDSEVSAAKKPTDFVSEKAAAVAASEKDDSEVSAAEKGTVVVSEKATATGVAEDAATTAAKKAAPATSDILPIAAPGKNEGDNDSEMLPVAASEKNDGDDDEDKEYPPSVFEGKRFYSSYPTIRSHILRNKGIHVEVTEGDRAGKYWMFGLEDYASLAFWDPEHNRVSYELKKFSEVNFSDELLSSEERLQFDVNSRTKESLDYMYRSGSACHVPFGVRQLPEYDPTPLEHGNLEAPEHRDRDGNIVDFSKVMPISIERLHYSGSLDVSEMTSMLWPTKPISSDASFTTNVLLCGSKILKPDITRWRRVYELYGLEYAEKMWSRFLRRGDLYAIPEHIICDRRFSRSQFDCNYLDYMQKDISELQSDREVTFQNLPYLRVWRFDAGYWYQHTKIKRALYQEKKLQNTLKLFVPFDSFECERMSFQELRCTFPKVTSDIAVLLEPLLADEPMPPAAYYYGVMLSEGCGLSETHPLRKFLESCLFLELVLIKVSTFLHTMLYGNKLIEVPPAVVDVLELSGVENIKISSEISVSEILRFMRKSSDPNLNVSRDGGSLRNVVKCSVPGLKGLRFHWVDAYYRNIGDIHRWAKAGWNHFFNEYTRNPVPLITVALPKNYEDTYYTIRTAPHRQKSTAVYTVPSMAIYQNMIHGQTQDDNGADNMNYQYNNDDEAQNTGYTGSDANQANTYPDSGQFQRTSSYNSAAGTGNSGSRKRNRNEFEQSDEGERNIKESQIYKDLLHKLSSIEGQRKHDEAEKKTLIQRHFKEKADSEAEKQALIQKHLVEKAALVQKHLTEKAVWAEEKTKIISEMNEMIVEAYKSVMNTRK